MGKQKIYRWKKLSKTILVKVHFFTCRFFFLFVDNLFFISLCFINEITENDHSPTPSCLGSFWMTKNNKDNFRPFGDISLKFNFQRSLVTHFPSFYSSFGILSSWVEKANMWRQKKMMSRHNHFLSWIGLGKNSSAQSRCVSDLKTKTIWLCKRLYNRYY